MIDTIINIINSGVESETWDFKEQNYINKASLVHDILSMTNQINDIDRYIIIGVSDPFKSTEIVGVNSENRLNQSQLVDILRKIKFAGDFRPNVELKTIIIKDKEIDLIIIHPTKNIPVYLTEDYRKNDKIVRANYIYTRVCDTNTPIDKSCDLYHVEKMWKKRFGIDKTSLERFKVLLDDINNWEIDLGNKKVAFHKYFPEYNILLGEIEEFYEPFSGSYLNHKSYLCNMALKFHSTILYESECWYLDETRLTIPKAGMSHINNIDYSYYSYYIREDLIWKLLVLFTKGDLSLSSRGFGGSQFVIYESVQEKDEFEDFLSRNPQSLDSFEPDFDAIEAERYQKRINQLTSINPLMASKIKKCLEHYKLTSDNTVVPPL